MIITLRAIGRYTINKIPNPNGKGRGTRRVGGGFTLIEVMVALVIISVSMVTLLSTHAISTRSYAAAKATAVCSLLAQQKLAELQSGELPPAGDTSGGFEDNENYKWALSVQETALDALREVTLEVSLVSAEGPEDEETEGVAKVTVTTSLADLGNPEEEEDGEEEKS